MSCDARGSGSPPLRGGTSLLLGGLALLAGCLDHTLPPDAALDSKSVFIALQSDFAPLESWEPLELPNTPIVGHPEGRRELHVKSRPPPGATEFPVGTIIAKTVESGALTDWMVHAMVKRGGDYNERGARGWEWFELRFTEARVPVIVWRGEVPPNGESYGCLAGDCADAPDCNECHAQAAENDFVKSEVLRLSEL